MTAFIHYVSLDCADPRRVAAFWATATGFVPVLEQDDLVALAAPDRWGVRGMLLWKVPEPKAGKNRMHLDLAAKDPEAEIRALVVAGASVVEAREGNGKRWTVMLDPEGNEFCIG